MRKSGYFFFFILITHVAFTQPSVELTVENIMRDPKWIGSSPSDVQWSADGKVLYFNWNPDKAPADSLYFITVEKRTPQKVQADQQGSIVYFRDAIFNSKRTAYVYVKNDDLFFADNKTGKSKRITQTAAKESAPRFSFNDTRIVYLQNDNLFSWDMISGEIIQLTNFITTEDPQTDEKRKKLNRQEEWLENDQLQLMEVLKKRKENKETTDAYVKKVSPSESPRAIYVGNKKIQDLQISSNGRYISYVLFKEAAGSKKTIIPDYVTRSGFTEDINSRTKVGGSLGSAELFVFDRANDTIIPVSSESLPGIRDVPDYFKEYPELLRKKQHENALRDVSFSRISWAPDGDYAVVDIRARDNKDRWLMKLYGTTGRMTLIDRQHDDAWIGGPGISNSSSGWINKNQFWFQSEVTGFSHIYVADIASGQKTARSAGQYEVQYCQLSADKKYFFIITNEVHPGEQQWYRLPVAGGKAVRITMMTGANQVILAPDEKEAAILYSYSNQPWELYLQENKPGSKPVQITFKAKSDSFSAYPWRDPELVNITAKDGKQIMARLYRPSRPHPSKPAVIFVHGAGYLQNAHKWWSRYFREYMFHNLLSDNGYYVLDMDYRASAGYGRDWRTGIYRHMGGKDLSDHIDGTKYLIEEFGVDPRRIGIYGGSYGGFITLMALFTSPGTFAAGAALRPVTDWAHYNHNYTSNILNTPVDDSIAYRRSSPVYFAGGLQDHLLICHGVVDVNVHFQDVVRLNQRLIELGKRNWQVALYPVEDHGFVEPSSWTDEYTRIYRLFEEVLKK